MALGDLNRFESVFAEAALGPRIWDRALGLVVRESESFGATLLPLAGVAIPNVPAIETSGETSEHYFRDGWHLVERRHATPVDLFCCSPDLQTKASKACNLTRVR
jgi:hypothetical protein